ncbi:trichohyalin isoform X4 [Channa argus]|uniref:trichohyalin isoform X4 n=1 Tax=Channa argus TaxID=215402 RepID=UPI0035221AFD
MEIIGDKKQSVKGEEENEEMKMYLHCPPVYPLPDEIKKMDSSDTACRYCGVSYLIFHEFHQLNIQLAQQESELQQLREIAQREKAQRKELELGRLDWERALYLEVQRQAEEKERSIRDELEEKKREMEKALRDAFENTERKRSEMEAYQKISEEKESKLKGMHGDLDEERKQREELEKKIEEREKVLNDALQKANKNADEQRKYLQQLEERLAVATSTMEEVEQLLGKEKQQGHSLRVTCARQQQALRATLSLLNSCGSELTDVRGFFSQLTGTWQVFRSQILQYSTQVFSVLREELKHSSHEFRKMREEKEHLTQQLMEQERQSKEQLWQQENCKEEQRQELLRLKGALEEKHERWLLCQRNCDTIQEQLLSWQKREEHMARKCFTAEEEVTRLKKALEGVQQEIRELKREREVLIESHCTVLAKMEEEFRRQMASKVASLQETVRRECMEREELTAALFKAQEELIGLISPILHQGSSRFLPHPMEKHTPPGNKHFHLHSQARVPLTRSSTSPNAVRPSLSCTDKDRGMDIDGVGTAQHLEIWNYGGVLCGEKKQEGMLPRLKPGSTVSKDKHKVSLVMGRKGRL